MGLLRYSAYIAVQHKHSVEFVEVATFERVKFSRPDIRLAEEIISIDYDLSTSRTFYVATKTQIYQYSCETLHI